MSMNLHMTKRGLLEPYHTHILLVIKGKAMIAAEQEDLTGTRANQLSF